MIAPDLCSPAVSRTAAADARASRAPATFETQIIALCRTLETWRQECRDAADSDPNDFPGFERKAALQALAFFVFFLVASSVWPILQIHRNTAALLFLTVALLISAVAAPMLFVFQAIGLAKAQFWRALLRIFSGTRSNYPFTPLINCIEHDCTQRERLRSFRSSVLTAAQERMNHEESELRERLNSFVGTPTIFVVFGVIAGSITAWQNYHAHPDSAISGFLFFGSIGMLLMGVFGFRLRISLTELGRCRSLLAFELACRGGAKGKRTQNRPPLSNQLRPK
jgi:hypothetical protein